MRWKYPSAVLLILALISPASGQAPPARGAEPPPRATEIPTEGFWPTRKMMDRIIDRIVDQMVKHYELDEDQSQATRDLLKDRYPAFMNQNRAEIQTLLNQYFEALLNDQPPTAEEAAEWAQHVQPLLADLGDETHEVMGAMREYLNDEQAVMLDAELTAFDTGLRFAQNKLSTWSAGGYDPQTDWIHPPREHDDETAAAAADAATDDAPAGADKTPASLPIDEWGLYTQRFIERYQLNDEQKQKALQILRRQQEVRDKYLRRKVDEMARVTKQLSDAATEEDRQVALRAFEQLNAPVDQLFQTLKERLLSLPTRAQRKTAEDAGLTAEDRFIAPPAEEPSASAPSVQPAATSQASPGEP
jgi:hypothetical protein